MARGFDSKSVTEQQDDAQRDRESGQRRAAPVPARLRTLQLARSDLLRRIEAAPEPHRDRMREALADLDRQIRELS